MRKVSEEIPFQLTALECVRVNLVEDSKHKGSVVDSLPRSGEGLGDIMQRKQ